MRRALAPWVLLVLATSCLTSETGAIPTVVADSATSGTGTSTSPPDPPETTTSTGTSTSPPSPPVTTTLLPPTTTLATFSGEVSDVDATRLSHSWREGCPLPPEDLRLIEIVYWDFDGLAHHGALIVHHQHAEAMLTVFEQLFDIGYPMSTVIPFGDLDEDKVDEPGRNNTSAFNCRFVAGTTRWSDHARGLAIDVNPQLNPYIEGDLVDPPEAIRYADRSLDEPGMIHPGDEVVEAFDSIGWVWGGTWNSIKDYHHFSATGR